MIFPETTESAIELMPSDEADLRAYFAQDLPQPPGAASSFGRMCERVANIRNAKTRELPTPFVVHADGTTSGAAWTEIVDCSNHMTVRVSDAEDTLIALVDAGRRMARVHGILAMLSEPDQAVLGAQYGAPLRAVGVAGAVMHLTKAARRENRMRASAGHHETLDETLLALRLRAKGGQRTTAERDQADVSLRAIRTEALTLLAHARASYARARAGVGVRT